MSRPFILSAPNGAHRGKADHPALPVTIAETIATASACARAGADGLHLHIRDDNGQHSIDPGRYREALEALADATPDLRLQITTEAGGLFDVATQLTTLTQVRPDWASISVREINRTPELAEQVYGTCAHNGTEVQHILYNAEDAALLKRWQAEGTVGPEQDSVLLVLGRYSAGQNSSADDLPAFLQALPPVSRWMLCAFGPQEHACLAAAAGLGGDVRVGFENSLLSANGTPHHDNAASVAELVATLEQHLPTS